MSLRSILSRLNGGRTHHRELVVHEVRALQADGAVLLDVRSRQEYQAGHAPGARNMPVDEITGRRREIPAGGTVVTICQAGGRSARAAAALTALGLQDVRDVRGGMTAWQRAGLPVQRP